MYKRIGLGILLFFVFGQFSAVAQTGDTDIHKKISKKTDKIYEQVLE